MRAPGEAVRTVDLALVRVPLPRTERTTVECRAVACFARTAHGKPFCLEHIHLMAYVGAIQSAERRPGRRRVAQDVESV